MSAGRPMVHSIRPHQGATAGSTAPRGGSAPARAGHNQVHRARDIGSHMRSCRQIAARLPGVDHEVLPGSRRLYRSEMSPVSSSGSPSQKACARPDASPTIFGTVSMGVRMTTSWPSLLTVSGIRIVANLGADQASLARVGVTGSPADAPPSVSSVAGAARTPSATMVPSN